MPRLNRFSPLLLVLMRHGPELEVGIVGASDDLAAHEDLSALGTNLVGTGFPEHAGAAAWVTEGVDQRLDDLATLGGFLLLGPQGVQDGGLQRESLDALSGPVGGDLLAAHSPDLFGVGLEEDVEEPLAE